MQRFYLKHISCCVSLMPCVTQKVDYLFFRLLSCTLAIIIESKIQKEQAILMPLIKVTSNKIWCGKISTDQTSHTSNGQDILRAWKCTKTSIGSLRTRIKTCKTGLQKTCDWRLLVVYSSTYLSCDHGSPWTLCCYCWNRHRIRWVDRW